MHNIKNHFKKGQTFVVDVIKYSACKLEHMH